MRVVRFADDWQDQLDALDIDYWRKPGIETGVRWDLARDPQESGQQVEGTDVWVMTFLGTSGDPHIAVYYVFNDTHVYVDSITSFRD